MRKRPEQVPCPDSYPYIRAQTSDNSIVVLRLPGSRRLEQIQTAMQEHASSALAALIGTCWRDEVYEIEAPPPKWSDVEAVLEYGEQVEEELRDHGMRPRDVLLLWGAILAEVQEQSSVPREAEERLRNFGVIPESDAS